jgi:rhodanese-related sulfurtransferase
MSLTLSAMAASDLIARLGTAAAPLVFDVRRRPVFEAAERLVAGARWRDPARAAVWGRDVEPGREIVVYCVHGHEVSQAAAALLQSIGRRARYLDGGFDAHRAAGGPTIARAARPDCDAAPSHWITRERPKVDRIACPWLVRRFVDPDAVIHYVAADRVAAVANEIGAIPFDIDGVVYSHDGELCSFDTCIARLGIEDAHLAHLARIVRGADTARLDLEPECAGLLAMALGLSRLHADDRAALEAGLTVYDALYAWVRSARAETHNWPADWSARGAA